MSVGAVTVDKESRGYLLMVLRAHRRKLDKQRARLVTKFGARAELANVEAKIEINDALTKELR